MRWQWPVLLSATHTLADVSYDVAETCRQPAGGILPLDYNGCEGFTGRCYSWMSAACDRGKCLCKDDECVMGQQCVPEGGCPTVTGGTCAISHRCNTWRNASCDQQSARCLCGPGTCPVKGECRPRGDCAKDTGGTCSLLGCRSWRRASCVYTDATDLLDARCMCGPGSCPVAGECVAKGGCPRFTGLSCSSFDLLGFFQCPVGSCEGSYCVCPEGQCFVDGQCVPADPGAIALSGASVDLSSKQRTGLCLVTFDALLLFLTLICMVECSRKAALVCSERKALARQRDSYERLHD